MKRNYILSLVAMLAVTVSLAYAGNPKAMSVNVPFEFYVQNQLLPAGEYNFEMGMGGFPTASVVLVRTSEDKGVRLLLTWPQISKGSNVSHLQFNQYNEKHFLSIIAIGSYKANVAMSELERELRIVNKTAPTETLVAQK
jgi:hypothetical protein